MIIIGFSSCRQNNLLQHLENVITMAQAREEMCHGLPMVPTSSPGFLVLGFMKSKVT